MSLKQTVPPELISQLEKAADFHGHLGPFLVIGVRMGMIGLKKISKNNHLRIDVSLPLRVPFSCIVDGLQVTTHCTVGNQKLHLKDSNIIKATFKRENDKMEVVVAVNKSMFEELRSQLTGKAILGDEIRKLAWMVAGVSEDELFKIT